MCDVVWCGVVWYGIMYNVQSSQFLLSISIDFGRSLDNVISYSFVPQYKAIPQGFRYLSGVHCWREVSLRIHHISELIELQFITFWQHIFNIIPPRRVIQPLHMGRNSLVQDPWNGFGVVAFTNCSFISQIIHILPLAITYMYCQVSSVCLPPQWS